MMHTIHNARIQLLATALNNLGVATIIAGILAPLVKGEVGSGPGFVVWLVVGIGFIVEARAMLGRLL